MMTAIEMTENANISISPGIKDLFDLDSELCCNSGQVAAKFYLITKANFYLQLALCKCYF